MAAAVVVEADAADPNLDPQYSNFAASVQAPPKAPVIFWDRFDLTFHQTADDVFADQLHPLNLIKWTVEPTPDRLDFQQRASKGAADALTKSVTYGLRDAAVDLPFMVWLDERQQFLADLLRYSVDDVAEESVAPTDVSYRAAERSWWKEISRTGAVRYGVRPFSAEPYAFVSAGIKDGQKFLLLSHVRYYYDHFSDHRFEIALSAPLADGFAMDVGTSYEIGRHGQERRLAVKVVKDLKSGGVVHLGFDVREKPVVIAGITFGW